MADDEDLVEEEVDEVEEPDEEDLDEEVLAGAVLEDDDDIAEDLGADVVDDVDADEDEDEEAATATKAKAKAKADDEDDDDEEEADPDDVEEDLDQILRDRIAAALTRRKRKRRGGRHRGPLRGRRAGAGPPRQGSCVSRASWSSTRASSRTTRPCCAQTACDGRTWVT